MTAFDRVWRVSVGTLRVGKPLRVAFDIERTSHATPNKAVVKLWNLTRDQQALIERATDAQLVVEAGHSQSRGLEQLFRGHVFRARGGTGAQARSIRTTTEGRVDAITHVEGRDGGAEFQQQRVAASFDPGSSAADVVRTCAEALGVGIGNTNEAIAEVVAAGGDATFPEGTVLSGTASRELTRILASFGLRWSVQHEALQVLRVGEPLRTEAVLLTTRTGLVGEPEPCTRGRVRARSILTPDLAPGRPVVLESRKASGRFTVRSVRYTGDSGVGQQDWYADVELAA